MLRAIGIQPKLQLTRPPVNATDVIRGFLGQLAQANFRNLGQQRKTTISGALFQPGRWGASCV